MATSFKKTTIKNFPRIGEKTTQDSAYWKNLEFPVTRKGTAAVTHIDFSPVDSYHYAVTNSSKVEIFSSRTHQVLKTLTRFREQAYDGSFRGDGKLIVAGSSEGHVRIFDVSGKALLRTFKESQSPVHVAKFASDNLHVISGSDDKIVRVYDVPSEKQIISYDEHKDYIRSGAVSKSSKDLFITGCYDHKVKLFDARTEESVLTVDHGAPVECVLMHPGGSLFYSAGGEVIKVWDALAGGRLLTSFSNHHKTITSLCFCSNHRRLVSAGLDRHVKIYDITTYEVVHTLDYISALLCVGVSADDNLISVGTADGYLISRRRRDPEELEMEKIEKKRQKKASFKYALQGKNHIPNKEDLVIEHKKKEQLAKYDKYFRRFDHTKALNAAMEIRVRSNSPDVTISVLQELIRRGGIKAALAGRDENSLSSIVRFLQKNISNSKYSNTVIDVTNMLLDIYKDQIGQSSKLTGLLKILKETVDLEVAYLKDIMEVMGILDTILTAAQTAESNFVLNSNSVSDSNLKVDRLQEVEVSMESDTSDSDSNTS